MTIDQFRCHLGTRFGWSISLGLAVLGAYLLWYHTNHLALALPYLFLLACPLMHLFGHGHGHSGHKGSPEDRR